VAVAYRREAVTSLSDADVIAFLSNSFAAQQRRLAGAPDPFPTGTVSAVLSDLVYAGAAVVRHVRDRADRTWDLRSQSGLRVSSAMRVARALRAVNPAALNRVTIIATAQLTDEVSNVRPPVNSRGWQREQATYLGELQRHGIAGPVLNALPGQERLRLLRSS